VYCAKCKAIVEDRGRITETDANKNVEILCDKCDAETASIVEVLAEMDFHANVAHDAALKANEEMRRADKIKLTHALPELETLRDDIRALIVAAQCACRDVKNVANKAIREMVDMEE
jgi:hypothetical protein